MRRYLILHVVSIAENRMIKAEINRLHRGNKLGGVMMVLNPLYPPPHKKEKKKDQLSWSHGLGCGGEEA